MSFLCRAQTTMSCYVTNFESLLLKEFSSNGMTKPLKTIIGVAIFSVNFPLQRKKGRNLLQPFRIFIQVFEDGKLKRKDWLNYMQMAKNERWSHRQQKSQIVFASIILIMYTKTIWDLD